MQGFFLMEDLFFKNRKIIKLYHHANTENKCNYCVFILCCTCVCAYLTTLFSAARGQMFLSKLVSTELNVLSSRLSLF
jgi:hypothetical protein